LDLKGRKANETENRTTDLAHLPAFFQSGHSSPWAHWYGKRGPAALPALLPHSCSLLPSHQFWHSSDSQLHSLAANESRGGGKRKQYFSASLAARNVCGSSKTAFFWQQHAVGLASVWRSVIPSSPRS